ncbi:MAG TPA: protein-disulfide reductase DsbD [Ideonella sp.]|uniref:protein-disulfide reductase DsbD n=1 Tax=Ideonella sp. TaxID=1929293 RepID=UPI002E31734C|nr:protein-disulfide reductase DsbD [Ideonella sp.]HEX5684246.1 protein-disulfide reductase DsbD [Ideonella sp.]
MNTLLTWARRLAVGLLAAAALLPAAHAADETFLDPAEAFRPQVTLGADDALQISFVIAPGYHLYRERFTLQADPTLAPLPAAALPAGREHFDTNFNRTMTLWEGTVQVTQALPAGLQAAALTMGYQGCADRGLCYPPQRGTVRLARDTAGTLTAAWEPAGDLFATPAAETAASQATAAQAPAPAEESNDNHAGVLSSGSLLKVVPMFLLGGLLLSFTPCVLPMLPILSSIIVGQGAPVSRRRGFTLALAYSLGMALVYTAAGVAAGLLGSGFAAALQNPWVLGSFAALLAVLSLSMFGVWELQMPAAIQQRVNNASNQLSGGRHLAVFAMGGLSALLVGPCVAAPLAGALVYISQTRDVLLGGAALFALAAGMSVPLLLLGLSAGSLLPRAGRWMEQVKTFFGLMLLAVALWLVSPVLPAPVLMFVLGAGVLAAVLSLGAFETGTWRLWRGVGGVAALWGVALMAGALSGGDSVVQPLRHLARAGGAVVSTAVAAPTEGPNFQRITSVQQLDDALRTAGRPVVLDVYADWCVSCKEMEHLTFRDAAVRPRLERALLLQADVTADSADAKALMKRFSLFGPPAVLFFDARGAEVTSARTIGFENATAFARRLDHAKL